MKSERSAAVQAAMARAQRHAGTAMVAAVLTPLAMAGLASPAHATLALTPSTDVSITGATSTVAGVTTFTYTVSNNALSANGQSTTSLDRFEIPEVAAGDLNLASFIGPNFGEGWTAVLEQTRTLFNTGFKSGPLPGAYILVSTYTGEGIFSGTSGTFSLTSTEPGTVSANFGVQVDAYNYGAEGYVVNEYGYVDPPVPAGPATTVPEPASMAILGGAVLLAGATRMRRKD